MMIMPSMGRGVFMSRIAIMVICIMSIIVLALMRNRVVMHVVRMMMLVVRNIQNPNSFRIVFVDVLFSDNK